MRAFKKHLQNPEKLIGYVKNGFDVYTELELSEYQEGTFYEAAIRWGTPELVKACIFEHLQDFSKPEQLQITALKKRLDTGREIIRILNEAGFHFSGMNRDDTYSSFHSVDFWVCESTQDDEEWYKRTPEEMLEDIYLHDFPEDDEYHSEEYYSDG